MSPPCPAEAPNMPRELQKVMMPTYTIEPPDILAIDAVRIVPRPPYRARSLDVLVINVTGTLPEAPIGGAYTIEPGGTVQLGPAYGSIDVAGLTLDEIKAAIYGQLRNTLKDPVVSVSLGELAGKQQIAGQHLVSADGTVTLGSYGSVRVVGMTLSEARHAIEEHLSETLEEPEVSVDVFAYNSKAFYIITQGAGQGDGVVRMPITGNETVLDAISQINGLEAVSSKKIWIARPSPAGCQILPVDWCAITEQAATTTNYQLLPGDRLFVAEDKLVALDTGLGKIIAPMERVFGVTLLGTSTVRSVRNIKSSSNGGGGF
jgi:polysaccharide export outer membrane protein